MIAEKFTIARVTIEFDTPLTIGTGASDDIMDQVFVTDANGLPALPGTSIAGALRHAVASAKGENVAGILFGKENDTHREGSRSLLHVSWGVVHGSDDNPVHPLSLGQGSIENDEVLRHLRAGVRRDHVRIDHQGTADDRGKFDELLIPAGARFTFELHLDLRAQGRDIAPPVSMDQLVALLDSSAFLLGGRTRRGFGAFHVVRAYRRIFDLNRKEDWKDYSRHPVALHKRSKVLSGMDVDNLPPLDFAEKTAPLRWHVNLTPGVLALFGGGTAYSDDGFEHTDMFSVREQRIVWSKQKGKVDEPSFFAPGSSIKGALRHRTAYYLHHLTGHYADGDAAEWLDKPKDTSNPAVVHGWHPQVQGIIDLVFGNVKTSKRNDERDINAENDERGQPGRVFVGDVWIKSERSSEVQHVSIDRFTQGPFEGALFSEAPVLLGEETIEVVVLPPKLDTSEQEDWNKGLKALGMALEDIADGTLQLGGGASRGNGVFKGEVVAKEVA